MTQRGSGRRAAWVLVSAIVVACGGSESNSPFGGRKQDAGYGGVWSANGGAAGASVGGNGNRGGGGTAAGNGGARPTDAGAEDTPCRNSLACASRTDDKLVCDTNLGICVECVANGDCLQGGTCQFSRCRPLCQSDRQCTPLGLLCDQGECVECKATADCANGRQCMTGACIGYTCVPERKTCINDAVAVCLPSGDGYAVPVPCGAGKTCVDDQFSGRVTCVLNGTGSGGFTGAGGQLGSGGVSSCRPAYCPTNGSGTPCCRSNGSCGIDFGMGCIATPTDAGAGGVEGSGGSSGSGGVKPGTGGSLDASVTD